MKLEILVNRRLDPVIAASCPTCGRTTLYEVERLSAGEFLGCECGNVVEVDARTLIAARELSVRMKECAHWLKR